MNSALIQSKGQSSDFLHTKAISFINENFKDKAILDVGCGTGKFLQRLEDLGFKDLTACDGMNYGISVNRKFVQVNLNEKWGFADESFDFVSSLEVIEHLENPRYFFREIYRILKNEGEVLISTPNNESITSILSLIVRGQFSAFVDSCYPAHITPVLRVDSVRMAKEAGFRSIEIFWSGKGRIPGTATHWQSFLGPLSGGKRTSDNFYLRAKK